MVVQPDLISRSGENSVLRICGSIDSRSQPSANEWPFKLQATRLQLWLAFVSLAEAGCETQLPANLALLRVVSYASYHRHSCPQRVLNFS